MYYSYMYIHDAGFLVFTLFGVPPANLSNFPDQSDSEEVGRKLRSRAKKSIKALNVLSRRYFVSI